MTKIQLRHIWEKTKGHCHFCGDAVDFAKRGWTDGDLTGFTEFCGSSRSDGLQQFHARNAARDP